MRGAAESHALQRGGCSHATDSIFLRTKTNRDTVVAT
jgi:hypothetical protein